MADTAHEAEGPLEELADRENGDPIAPAPVSYGTEHIAEDRRGVLLWLSNQAGAIMERTGDGVASDEDRRAVIEIAAVFENAYRTDAGAGW